MIYLSPVLRAGLFVSILVLAMGCRDKEAAREWRPEDHAQPTGANLDSSRAAPTTGQDRVAQQQGDPTARAATALFRVTCASCHGAEGRGDGAGRAPGMAVPDLTSPDWQSERTDEDIARVIAEGQGLMPAFADRIRPEGIAALVQHVRRMTTEEISPTP